MTEINRSMNRAPSVTFLHYETEFVNELHLFRPFLKEISI
jgi:hypothetical protein